METKKNNKFIINTSIFIITSIIFYLLSSLVLNTFNIFKWGFVNRFSILILYLSINTICISSSRNFTDSILYKLDIIRRSIIIFIIWLFIYFLFSFLMADFNIYHWSTNYIGVTMIFLVICICVLGIFSIGYRNDNYKDYFKEYFD